MNLDEIPERFRRSLGDDSTAFSLYPRATSQEIANAEMLIAQPIPKKISKFFLRFNGFDVKEPSVKFLSIDQWAINGNSFIPFALIDKTNWLQFDCTAVNVAGEWDILGPDTSFCITHSFASLYTIHLWKWIDRRIPFWQADWLDYAESKKTYSTD